MTDQAKKERAKDLYRAQLSMYAEKFDELVYQVRSMSKYSTFPHGAEEREVFSAAFCGAVEKRRDAWRTLASTEQKEVQKQKAVNTSWCATYREKVEQEILSTCKTGIDFLETRLGTAATAEAQLDKETRAFFLKMKADLHYWVAEVTDSHSKERAAVASAFAYEAGMEEAKSLPPAHPVRVGIALNFAVLTYEILNRPEEAMAMAREAASAAGHPVPQWETKTVEAMEEKANEAALKAAEEERRKLQSAQLKERLAAEKREAEAQKAAAAAAAAAPAASKQSAAAASAASKEAAEAAPAASKEAAEAAPAEGEAAAAEAVPAEGEAAAAEAAPAEGEAAAAESAPAEGEAAAADGETAAAEATPADGEPAAAELAPAEGEAAPAEGEAAADEAAPAEGEAAADDTAPAEDEAAAADAAPAEEEAAAADGEVEAVPAEPVEFEDLPFEVQSLIEQIHDSVLLWEADLPMLSTLRENWRTETPDTRTPRSRGETPLASKTEHTPGGPAVEAGPPLEPVSPWSPL